MPHAAGAVAEVAEVAVVAEELLLLQAVVLRTRRPPMHLNLHLKPQKRIRLPRTTPPIPPPLKQPQLPAPAQRDQHQQQGQQLRPEEAVLGLANSFPELCGGHNWTERRSRKRRRRNSRTRRPRMRA